MTNYFDKTYTQAVKGVAILLLLAHHLLGRYCLFQIPGINIKVFVVHITKVCVALFTILSGYGIAKSYLKKETKDIRFVGAHLKKLLINYWFVYIPMLIISFYEHTHGTPIEIYGNGLKGIGNFLLDFMGMKAILKTPTLNQTWWYMAVPIICYLLFPIFYRAIKKSKIGTLIVTIIPCIVADIIAFKTHSRIEDNVIFYIFPFIVGIILANDNVLNKIMELCNKKAANKWIIGLTSVFAIVIFLVLSSFFALVVNVFYAISIIVFVSVIKNNKQKFLGFFELLGKHSMNIFLVHSFFYIYFIDFYIIIRCIDSTLIKYVLVLLISFITSVVIEEMKKILFKIIKRIKNKKEQNSEMAI